MLHRDVTLTPIPGADVAVLRELAGAIWRQHYTSIIPAAQIDPLAELAETNAQALDALLRDVQTGSEGLAGMWDALARENGLLPEDKADVTPLELKPPPTMAWVLIGVPVVRFGDIQPALDRIAAVPDVMLLSTANDTRAED